MGLACAAAVPSNARAPSEGELENGHAGNGDAENGYAGNGELEPEHREYQIKAAFLLNFIRYTTWPAECFPDAEAPVVLTVVGRDPFGAILEETFEGEQANGRRVVIVRTREVPAELTGHVVFCADLPRSAREKLLAAARRRALLLVGETTDFAADGACINFYLEDKKTRFEVNTDALAAARLVISPAVLKLAKIVKSRREERR